MQLSHGLLLLLLLVWSPLATAQNETWRPVTDWNLSLIPQSSLDFTSLVEEGPAGKHGRVVIRPEGGFAFASQISQPVRFFCASQPYGVEEGFPDHATADRYARQLRMHGYNLARFTFVDNVLMNGRTRNFDFDPIQLDRFQYFLAALKREGIYWMLDGLTSWNAAYGDVGGDRWAKKRNVKLGVYYDPIQQAHWKELISRLLGQKNNYTGLRPLDDPALVGIILLNEGSLNYLIHQTSSPEMDRLFEKWLVGRYGTFAVAKQRWGFVEAATTDVTLPRRVWVTSPKMIDTQRFYYELQVATTEWMTSYIRGLGYQGPVTAFDNWSSLQDHATRASLLWVDMHTYHDHPSAFVNPGSQIKQSSSLDKGLEYVRNAATTRYWGKPFTVTEYDQPFWNRWRFESGLAMGAYAGFQGWDLLCRHGSGPIELAYGVGKGSRRKAIYPFGIGMDPIARAGETLTALLYLRGDVQLAKKHIGLRLTPEYVFAQQGGIGKLPDDIARLGLITGIGLLWQDAKEVPTMDAIIDPGGLPPTLPNKLADKLGLGIMPRLPAVLADLRKRGILAGNKSDGKTYYESDTGEISLDTDSRVLKVVTPRTEAVAFEKAPGKLDVLTVQEASGPALVSASSLDGEALGTSRRILLILAADARNSGMQFTGQDENELIRLGGMPILLRNIKVKLSLKNNRLANMSLYALRLNGERAEKIPMDSIDRSSVVFTLDTGALASGPTTYFELVEN